MPQLVWPSDPMTTVQGFEKKHNNAEAGALVMWAVWSVDTLAYLDDLDALLDKGNPPVNGHPSAALDIAHVRWATGTAITALDLCAAALARLYCAWKGSYEADLRNFDQNSKGSAPLRGSLSPSGVAWVDGVLADARYKNIHGARNPMTHSRLRRHFAIGDPQKSNRTHFLVTPGGNASPARGLVSDSKNLAVQHVASFLQLIANA